MPSNHPKTEQQRKETEEREQLITRVNASKRAALERFKAFCAEHGDEAARKVTYIEPLDMPVALTYVVVDGIPRVQSTQPFSGTSLTLWAYWADLRLLDDGLLVQMKTRIIGDRKEQLCLLVRPQELSIHQLKFLEGQLAALFA